MAKANEPVDNFDDLFSDVDDVTDVDAPAQVEDPEKARIQELEARLAEPLPSFDEVLETPTELTADQLRIQELEDQLAKRNALVAENSPTQYAQPVGDGEHILIHVLIDGFVAKGEVWYRGQELEFVVGSRAYEETKDRNGNTWVSLASDPGGQIRRWGVQYLGTGPFVPRRGETFDDELVAKDARRGRAVPISVY